MESPSSNKNLIYPCTSLRFVLFLDLFKNFFAYFKVTQCSSTFSSRNYIVLSFHIWIENLFRISFSMKYDIDIKSCFFFFLYECPNLIALLMRRPPFLPALPWHLSHDSRVRISVDVSEWVLKFLGCFSNLWDDHMISPFIQLMWGSTLFDFWTHIWDEPHLVDYPDYRLQHYIYKILLKIFASAFMKVISLWFSSDILCEVFAIMVTLCSKNKLGSVPFFLYFLKSLYKVVIISFWNVY